MYRASFSPVSEEKHEIVASFFPSSLQRKSNLIFPFSLLPQNMSIFFFRGGGCFGFFFFYAHIVEHLAVRFWSPFFLFPLRSDSSLVWNEPVFSLACRSFETTPYSPILRFFSSLLVSSEYDRPSLLPSSPPFVVVRELLPPFPKILSFFSKARSYALIPRL